jgi:pentatricopeptide repeat protein
MGLDSITISIILLMYAYLESLQHTKEIHGYNIRTALGFNSFVETSLIYMFVECGCIENACLVFDRISQGDIATWNAMIAGYDMHGHGGDSIALIDKMKEVGFVPNHITFTALFSACNHVGIIDEGWKSFDCII